mgnify:CR=1 FL=1
MTKRQPLPPAAQAHLSEIYERLNAYRDGTDVQAVLDVKWLLGQVAWLSDMVETFRLSTEKKHNQLREVRKQRDDARKDLRDGRML